MLYQIWHVFRLELTVGEDQGFVFAFSNLHEVRGMALEAQHEVHCRGMLGLLSLLASHIVSIVAYNPVTYVIPTMLPVLRV